MTPRILNANMRARAFRSTTRIAGIVALGVATAGIAQAQTSRIELELEAGPAWISRNNAQIPNNSSATRFSLNEITGSGPWPAGRAYLTWNLSERHSLRALAAPLSITETGVLRAPVNFAGGTYAASAPLTAKYTFNSYRLSYRYRLRNTDRTRLWVGATAKIRDATVQLTQGSTSTRKDDLGFVPLLHLAGDWRATQRFVLRTDIDALAGGPGRAIDAALKVGYDRGGRVAYHAGYRTVEGGADVDEVYSFAWVHFAVASVTLRW
jgi:hypothetical protein